MCYLPTTPEHECKGTFTPTQYSAETVAYCQLEQQLSIIVFDYYSKFPLITKLNNIKPSTTICHEKSSKNMEFQASSSLVMTPSSLQHHSKMLPDSMNSLKILLRAHTTQRQMVSLNVMFRLSKTCCGNANSQMPIPT